MGNSKTLPEEKNYKTTGMYNRKEVESILDCKRSKAYGIIQDLNEERKRAGLIVIPGRIPVEDFNRKYFVGYSND